MGINDKLLREIGPDKMNKYDLCHNKAKEFLYYKAGFPKKQDRAIKIIDKIIKQHGDKSDYFCPHLEKLANLELNTRVIAPYLRDHVVHALLSFILGIYWDLYK